MIGYKFSVIVDVFSLILIIYLIPGHTLFNVLLFSSKNLLK